MAQLFKWAKRAVRRVTFTCGQAVLAVTPRAAKARMAPYARYAEMLFGDHLFIRLFFPNRHRLSDEAWRGAQPLPHQLHDLARRGVKTIVNLRGARPTRTLDYERRACRQAGLNLVDFRVRSRGVPTREEVLAARELFQTITYPMLMHCKSGADRAGLMSALYLHVRRGVPIAEAKQQLSIRYGHIRYADTGVLDHFFERYLEHAAREPIEFFDWVATVYDPADVSRTFKARGWANRIVNGLLKRE